MTDETKKLFTAPWSANSMGEVRNAEGYLVSTDGCFAWSPALARLPELYDALMEAVNDACQDCVDETYERTGILFDPANDGCVYPERECCPKCRSWIELLRKVRDGEGVPETDKN